VNAAAEGHYRGCALAGDVEPAGVVVYGRITVAAKVLTTMSVPAGKTTPPSSTSSSTVRSMPHTIGEWRMVVKHGGLSFKMADDGGSATKMIIGSDRISEVIRDVWVPIGEWFGVRRAPSGRRSFLVSAFL
jgi:hypothetical protein